MLDVHGGTSEEEVLEVFGRAEQQLGSDRVIVFLDEVNAAPHLGELLSECQLRA